MAALVSTLLVGGSALVYATFARYESSLEAGASLGALVGLANQAVEKGTSSSTIFLPSSTVACAQSVITLAFGNSSISSPMPLDCDFAISVSAGAHTVTFDRQSSELYIEVS